MGTYFSSNNVTLEGVVAYIYVKHISLKYRNVYAFYLKIPILNNASRWIHHWINTNTFYILINYLGNIGERTITGTISGNSTGNSIGTITGTSTGIRYRQLPNMQAVSRMRVTTVTR